MADPVFAWCAFCTDGSPRPFLCKYVIRASRREVQEFLGAVWRRPDETVMQGWRRAYRNGWSAVRVADRLDGEVNHG